MIVGLPVSGISTMFYAVLLVGMAATKVWRWVSQSIRHAPRVGHTGASLPRAG